MYLIHGKALLKCIHSIPDKCHFNVTWVINKNKHLYHQHAFIPEDYSIVVLIPISIMDNTGTIAFHLALPVL